MPSSQMPDALKKRIKAAVLQKGKGGVVRFSHF